jgi:hypothetical protein
MRLSNLAIGLSLLFFIAISRPAAAQTSDPQKVNRAAIANFDAFLDAHPGIEQDLEKDPKLMNNSNYLASHPELKTFLASQPALNAQATHNPRELMNRVNRFEKSGRDIPKADLKAFDDFLDQHPGMEKELKKNPSLLSDPTYLTNHPDLKSFLAAHPSIQQDISENPRTFMKAEKRFDKAEDKAERKEAKLEHKAERRSPTPPPHSPGFRK